MKPALAVQTRSVAAACLLFGCIVNAADPPDPYAAARSAMQADIQAMDAQLRPSLHRGPIDERVIDALGTVPRHNFVPVELQNQAYENRALPIGAGQTISQPYIVALMTDLAALTPGSVVLEVGTGSGYQAAVLGELASEVYTIEIIPELGEKAGQLLASLGYVDVHVRIGDGYLGWPDHAPFDAVIVTAAAARVPPPLLDQLRVGGRLVIPVGEQDGPQSLQVLQKSVSGVIEVRDILQVGFVPLTGDH